MKSYLFVMPGAVPIANLRVSQLLMGAFTDLDCEVLDYSKALRSSPLTLMSICLRTVFESGPGVLKSRASLRNSILRSVATEAWIKKWVASRVSAGDVAFTFQMQSLFDAGVPGCPHFVFTDHTRLENLTYPDSEMVRRPPQEVIDREAEI